MTIQRIEYIIENKRGGGIVKKLSYNEAAEYLNMKKKLLYRLVLENKIPHTRISQRRVFFEEKKLNEWLKDKERGVIY